MRASTARGSRWSRFVAVLSALGCVPALGSCGLLGAADASIALSDLTVLEAVGFTPEFQPDTLDYAVGVDLLATDVTVRPTAQDEGATITVNGVTVASGADSDPIPLSGSVTFVNVEVTHPDVPELRRYVLYVTRSGSDTPVLALKHAHPDAGDQFGNSVAAAGSWVLVGAPDEDGGASGVGGDETDDSVPQAGAAFLFDLSGAAPSQAAYLKASDPGEGDHFGQVVAMSGSTLVVGAPEAGGSGVNELGDPNPGPGAVYVFLVTSTGVEFQAKVTAPDGDDGDAFGCSVTIDGDLMVVGAFSEASAATGVDGDRTDDSAPNAGAAYVFVRSGTAWTFSSYLKASNTREGAFFGSPVTLSGDTLVVGSYLEASPGRGIDSGQTGTSSNNSGASYVFRLASGTWSQQHYVKPSNSQAIDYFMLGSGSLRIAGDFFVGGAAGEDGGSTGVGGDPGDESLPGSGAAYLFGRDGSTWEQVAYVKASNPGEGDEFGVAVAVTEGAFAVGAPNEDGGGTGLDADPTSEAVSQAGAVYLYVHDGSAWVFLAYLKPSDVHEELRFGWELAFGDGFLAIGAPGHAGGDGGVDGDFLDRTAPDAGAVYVYR